MAVNTNGYAFYLYFLRIFVLVLWYILLYNRNIESWWGYGDTKVSRKNI